MKRLSALLMVAVMLLTQVGFAYELPNEQKDQKKLISLDFPGTPLSTVLDVLSIKTSHKFLTDSELASKRIVFNLKDVTPEEALNALLDTYGLYYIRQADTNIYVIKSRSEAVVTTVSKVFFLNYSTSKELENVLRTNLTRGGSLSADERTNSLIVTDVADNLDKIESLIKALDIPTLQVLLEAKIVDVKIDNSLSYGADLTAYRTNKFWTSPLALQRSSLLTDYTVAETAIMPETMYQQTLMPALGSGQFSASILSGDYNIEAAISALKSDSNARLLTNPRLLVMNNREATIDIIEQIPYSQSTESSLSAGVSKVTVAFKDVGIKLKVKPQINRDGSIVLGISPEQSFRTGESLDGVPVIYTSRSNTTFVIKSGETAVIGGLIKENDSTTENKIPLLGDIPLLGILFKKYSREKVRSELTIFITAKVIQQ